jgi:hypothetical protein
MIAEHVNRAEHHQRVHRPPRVERTARHVAEIDDVVDAPRADVGDSSLKREMIFVHIGNRGKAHRHSKYRTAQCVPDAAQRASDALLIRDPYPVFVGPGSASRHCVPRRVRDTGILSRRRAVQAKHMAGEIKRPGDEDARRHLIGKARQRTQRRLDTGCGFHPHAQLTHGIR